LLPSNRLFAEAPGCLGISKNKWCVRVSALGLLEVPALARLEPVGSARPGQHGVLLPKHPATTRLFTEVHEMR